MSKKKTDAFVRWQATTNSQLGHANNLVVGLSVGGLAFIAHLLVDGGLAPGGAICLLMVAGGWLLLSTMSGLACVMTRLYDFRATAQIARGREKGLEKRELDELRSETKSLGRWTWRLFWSQVVCFALGASFLVVAVAAHSYCSA